MDRCNTLFAAMMIACLVTLGCEPDGGGYKTAKQISKEKGPVGADDHEHGAGPHGGAITAALFLEEFVGPDTPWVHFDIMAWNLSERPGRPQGGEAMGLRAVYALVAELAGGGKPKAKPKPKKKG